MNMKKQSMGFTLMAALLVSSVGLFGNANAAPGGIPGPPDDGGGGAPPQDFGDLIILYRNTSGVPYLNPAVDGCQQPLPSDACLLALPDDCTLVDGTPSGVDVLPVDPATCAVTAACATCTEEVDFGRVNVSRAPASVFEQQLADVVVNLATSDCVVSLDPAGRMVTSAGTIDSPLQNLAIYRQLMLTGTIGVSLPQSATVLDTAARGLGVASDKTGEVNVDLVAYLNQIMGLSDPATDTYLDKICININQEVQGTVQLVEECFLDYGDYGYIREDNFLALPAPPYIPGTPGTPVDGWFEYLAVTDPLATPADARFQILQGSILDAVFCVDADGLPVLPVDGVCVNPPNAIGDGFLGGNIGGFSQAADDTRAVINFMHDWAIPDADVYATAVPCEALSGITYDVSISDVTGLQVPKNYVNGGEREFTVTVANAGPDPASGTVTVTADLPGVEPGTGELGSWDYGFTELAAGGTDSNVQLFTITTDSDTIEWRAVVEAPYDVIESNNTVTATSTVKASGGGGGGNGGQGGNPN
jgi:hypothetical protein